MTWLEPLVEVVGFGFLLAFLWFLWSPLVLLGAGLLCVAWANRPRASRVREGLTVADLPPSSRAPHQS